MDQAIPTSNLKKEDEGSNKVIKRYESNFFMLNSGEHYQQSIALLNDQIYTDLTPERVDQINAAHIQAWLALNPDLVLIGTGPTHEFLPSAWQALFYQRKIGLDTMPTSSACRTFSILALDERNALGIFFPI